MRIKGIAKKIAIKASGIFLRFPGIYSVVSSSVRGKHSELPSCEWARHVLREASPSPCPQKKGGVRPRMWPKNPQYDISVVIPCYNVEHFVKDAVVSVVEQKTSRSFEVIAIDDGSTDSTGIILDGLADTYFNLKVIHQSNRGLSGARNVGIAQAQGRGIVFVDSDDILKSGALEVLSDAQDQSGVAVVTASYENMSEDGGCISPLKGKRAHGAPWGRLYSREVWRDVDFPEGYWFEDTVQSFLIDPRFSGEYVDESVYFYRRNRTSISSRCMDSKKSIDTFYITEYLIDRAQELGINYCQSIHNQLVYQLGPIMLKRCVALNVRELKALFVCSCELYGRCSHGMECDLGSRWCELERSLRDKEFLPWLIAACSLS